MTELPEDGEPVNFEAIIGQRIRLVQEKDERATEKAGQRVDKKTGKKYDRTTTVVAAVYEADEKPATAAKSTKTTGKAAKPAVVARVSKANGKAADDHMDRAVEVLQEILAEADGSIARSKLSLAVTKKLMKDPLREDLRKLIFSEEFLNTENGWSYDGTSKAQTVSLA